MYIIGSGSNENANNLREYENGRPCTKSNMIHVQNHIWLRNCVHQYKIIYDFICKYLIFLVSIKSYMIFSVNVKSYMILYMSDHSRIFLNSYHSRMNLFLGSGSNENVNNLRKYENVFHVQHHTWFTYKIIYDYVSVHISIKSYMIFSVNVKSYMILYMGDDSLILLNS